MSERKIHEKYLFRSDFKNQELQGNTGGEGFGFTAAACDINGKNLNQGTVLGIQSGPLCKEWYSQFPVVSLISLFDRFC